MVPIEITNLLEEKEDDVSVPSLFNDQLSKDTVMLEWPSVRNWSYRRITIFNSHHHNLMAPNLFDDTLLEFGVWHNILETLHGSNLDKVYFFDPLFFTKLKEFALESPENRYEEIKKWTFPHSIFSKDFVLFPINVSQIHWYSICCIRPSLVYQAKDNRSLKEDKFGNLPCILVMDSLSSKLGLSYYENDIKFIKEYLTYEWMEKSCTLMQTITGEVTYETERPKWNIVQSFMLPTPRQPKCNGWDCGVYTIRNCNNIITHCPDSSKVVLGNKFAIYIKMCQYKHSDIVEDREMLMFKIRALIDDSYSDSNSKPKERADSSLFHFSENNRIIEIDQDISDNEDLITAVTRSSNGMKQQGSPNLNDTILVLSDFSLRVFLKPAILDLILLFLYDNKCNPELLLIEKILRQKSINYQRGLLGDFM